jgi:hypothetical protein
LEEPAKNGTSIPLYYDRLNRSLTARLISTPFVDHPLVRTKSLRRGHAILV